MTTAALITKLKKKLEKETDQGILRSIEILLRDQGYRVLIGTIRG